MEWGGGERKGAGKEPEAEERRKCLRAGVCHGGGEEPPPHRSLTGAERAPPSPLPPLPPPAAPPALTPSQGLVVAEEADAGLLGAHDAPLQSMASPTGRLCAAEPGLRRYRLGSAGRGRGGAGRAGAAGGRRRPRALPAAASMAGHVRSPPRVT